MTMLDRMARAIAGMKTEATWMRLSAGSREMYVGMARAALEAMRIPSDDMIAAAVDGTGLTEEQVIDVWADMITEPVGGHGVS